MADLAAIENLLQFLTPAEKAELDALLATGPVWDPLPGPQTEAYNSQADIIGYGGAAGGGKTDLLAGLCLTKHKRALVIRREKAQTDGIVQRLTEILGSTDGYNSQKSTWRAGETLIEFGGLDNPGDERRWQGRAHDLKAYDEVTEMREAQVRFTMGWLRSSDATVRSRILMTFNPPTTAEGQWVIKFFGPWLDPLHPNPAKPGELRWFTTVNGQDEEVPDSRPFVLVDKAKVYDFNPKHYKAEDIVTPKSRTFIPARVTDNPYYMRSGYMATLQAMPEPLRSQMLYGDFRAGMEDDPWQVLPTAWVDAAMARWKARDKKGTMDSMGVDVARGGKDHTVISRRHDGLWFDELLAYPGKDTPDGPTTASYVVKARRDRAPVHVDVVGWGAAAYDALKDNRVQTVSINGANKSHGIAENGTLRFANLRAELYWRMREALDPANDTGIALPNDPRLRADLCAPTWKLRGGAILVESKEEIIKRIGRSPDFGDAVTYALIDTLRTEDRPGNGPGAQATKRRAYNPYDKK